MALYSVVVPKLGSMLLLNPTSSPLGFFNSLASIFFDALHDRWQIPRDWDTWAAKCAAVGTKIEGKCPFLNPHCSSVYWWHSRTLHRRPKLITWKWTWLLLASGVVLRTVIYKGLYGIDRFFLKEIKNVMFLNKIDVPYCLVVFF